MKRCLLLGAMALLIGSTACETITPEVTPCPEGVPATLSLSIATDQTKSTVSQTQEQDNKIVTLDVFVFRNTAASASDHYALDVHKRFQGNSLNDLTLTCSTGPKIICVLANAHTDNFKGITNLDDFREQTAHLKTEALGNFTMYGETSMELGLSGEASVTIRRLVAKIQVSSIKTRFAGTPYEGMTLSNVKLYVTNAHAAKIIYNNQNPATPIILNQGSLSLTDMEGFAEEGLLYDTLTGTINDTGYSTAHYFYCYENITQNQDACSKLVLQADLNGTTYYYPVPINQTDYGYVAANGHYGIQRNTAYSIGITVTGQGSISPDEPLVQGSLELSLTIENWITTPHFDKEF